MINAFLCDAVFLKLDFFTANVWLINDFTTLAVFVFFESQYILKKLNVKKLQSYLISKFEKLFRFWIQFLYISRRDYFLPGKCVS